jgi:hypothetical protein
MVNSYKSLVGKPEEKSPVRRLTLGGKINITVVLRDKGCECVDLINLGDRDWWRALDTQLWTLEFHKTGWIS